MRSWVAIALAVTGIAAAGLAFTIAQANHAFDGCRVSIRNDAAQAEPWNLTYRGATRDGRLAPGATTTQKLCTFAPRDAPDILVGTAHGAVRATVDPFCSDIAVSIRDDGTLIDTRTCE